MSASGRRSARPSSRWARSAISASGRGRPRARSRRRWPRWASAAGRAPTGGAARSAATAARRSRRTGHRHLGGGGRRRRAAVGGEVDQRGVGLVADGGDQRDAALGGGADDDLLVEAPEVLEAAAAARDDEHVGPRHRAAGADGVEAADGGGDLGGAALALHGHRPEQHAAREALAQAVEDVADDRAEGEVTTPITSRQLGQRALARRRRTGPRRRAPSCAASSIAISAPTPAGAISSTIELVFRRAVAKVVSRPVAMTSMPSCGWMRRRCGGHAEGDRAERRRLVLEVEIDWPEAWRVTRPTSPRTRTRPNSPSSTRFTAPEISETVNSGAFLAGAGVLEELHRLSLALPSGPAP